MAQDMRLPSVLISYPGPCENYLCNDIFIYLRPETNGVEVESTLLRVVRNNGEYRDSIKLVYLANIPGDFIVKNKIVEEHYSCQIYFAEGGKECFTENMKRIFESYFHQSLKTAEVISPFQAMKQLSMDADELFNIRVPLKDMLLINGQSIKKYKNIFIINYDIPAILHKNNNKTDIAAMILRTNLEYSKIHRLIDDMGEALIDANILRFDKPLSRVFHYSKGPFNQIRDALGYLYQSADIHVPISKITFAAFLIDKGFSEKEILKVIRNPIIQFRTRSGDIAENDIFSFTANDSFSAAAEKLVRSVSKPGVLALTPGRTEADTPCPPAGA